MERHDPSPLAVLTVGGSALMAPDSSGSHREQVRASRRVARCIITLIQEGYRVVVVHGNGPQVGLELMRNEEASSKAPPRPLDLCVAASQGTIGELLCREIRNLLRREQIDREVLSVHTQVLVSREDPAFEDSKMVGPLLSEWRARELAKTTKWRFVQDSGRGWRRVVPSPKPVDVLGIEAIAPLVEAGVVLLAGGGGGVPLAVDAKGEFVGVEAVIDKDLTAALIADQLAAEMLILLMEVDNLYTHYGRPEQEALEHVSADELRALADQGHFPAESVGPKVEAALQFVHSGGQTAVITSAEKLAQALADRGGTRLSLRTRTTGVRHQLPLFDAEAALPLFEADAGAPDGALGDP